MKNLQFDQEKVLTLHLKSSINDIDDLYSNKKYIVECKTYEVNNKKIFLLKFCKNTEGIYFRMNKVSLELMGSFDANNKVREKLDNIQIQNNNNNQSFNLYIE